MRRLDYLLHTSQGNYLRYIERYNKRLFFEIKQETYSKKGMPAIEKNRFQLELDAYMRANRRTTYRGPVVLQLDFFPKRGNPPNIEKLAKNYIDLLYPRESKKLRLPMKDDRQISMLIVNYHVRNENEEPLIRLTLASMRDFLEDLQLYEKIRLGIGFSEDDGEYAYDEAELINDVDNRDPNALDYAWANLEGYREMASSWEDKTDFRMLEKHYIEEVQSAFMKGYEIKPMDFAFFFRSNERYRLSALDSLLDHRRKLIISAPFNPLPPTGLPIKEGDNEIFKMNIRTMLDKYKERFEILEPLLINLKVTILYVPSKDHEKDLDNLARRIVPLINDVLKPPVGLWFDTNPRPKGFPNNSIIQYQIVKLPRFDMDPEEGVARVILGEYEPYNNLWNQTDRLIDAWANRAW